MIQRINRRNDRVGHLFQGRFKAILIEESAYFKKLLRYIHLNPLRAYIVDDPAKYFWSSHRAYLRKETINWLTCEYGLSKFSNIKEVAISSYSQYLSQKISEEELSELRAGFKEGQILGDDLFLDNLKERSNAETKSNLSLKSILLAVCYVCSIDEQDVLSISKDRKASFARGILSIVASLFGNFSIKEIAAVMNREGSTISRLLLKFSLKHKNSLEIQQLIEKVRLKAEEITELHV